MSIPKKCVADIIIVGSGIVGSALACMLAQQTSLSIAVIEAAAFKHEPTKHYHPRVSAISLSSQRIFNALNVWDHIKQMRVSPFNKIHVWDDQTPGVIDFVSNDIAESVLGFIIENNVMQLALQKRMQDFPNIKLHAPIKLVEMCQSNSIELTADDGSTFSAQLAIAADGANSWLRTKAGIHLKKHDYEQTAIVATVTTALPHQKTARQVFRNTGPLAFLPLQAPHLSSIVWSLPSAEAERLLALNDDQFQLILAQAFSHQLGDITHIEKRYAFPLAKQQAEKYIAPHIALVGDAAHTVHPLAGQGVNMGLLDAASLAEVIQAAWQKQRDFASVATLRRYERWRRADNLALAGGIDLLKSLFASDQVSLQGVRALGLNLTNKLTFIKNSFMRHAVGNRGNLPNLAE